MSPDVVRAVDELAGKGILPSAAVPRLRAAASGELISVRRELEALLYVGVLLVVSGVGLLVKRNLDRIGPVAIAAILAIVSIACLAWCVRRRGRDDLAFDYVLLLGALLAAADLAFIEWKFTPLGAYWTWHLLVVAAFYLALAAWFDSRTMFGLALTSFAAWRGVSLYQLVPWDVRSERPFVEALACGALFVVAGKLLERVRWKPHFEPVATWLGMVLFLGALAWRMTEPPNRSAVAVLLVLSGAFFAWLAIDEGRIGRFSLGLAAVGLGLCALAFRGLESVHAPGELAFLVVVVLAAAVVIAVMRVHKATRGRA